MKKICIVTLLSIFFAVTTSILPDLEAKEKVKLGCLYSLTGPYSQTGQDATRGVDIATEMINQRGGLLGKEVVIIKGDELDQKTAMSEAERLYIQENVNTVIGGWTSAHAYAVKNVAEKHRKIYWIPSATGDAITQKGQKYTFRLGPLGTWRGAITMDFINDMVGPKLGIPKEKLKVAILHEDSLLGRELWKGAESRIDALKINLVSRLEYHHGAIDLTSEITRIKVKDPDVTVLFSSGPDTFLFWRQAKAANFNMKCFIGFGPIGMPDFVKSFPNDYEYVCHIAVPIERIDPKVIKTAEGADLKEFRDRYKNTYGAPPGGPASHAFGGAWLFYKHVIPKAKSFDPEAIREAALSLDIKEGETVSGYGFKFAPPDHQYAGTNLKATVTIQQWKDKYLHPVYPKAIASKELELPMPKWHERK